MGARVRGERGQAVPLMVTMVLFTAVLVLAVARLGAAADAAARARTAADAAALAGALEGRAAADALASANGAVLERFEQGGSTVEVVVSVGGARARAVAMRSVVWVPPP